MAAKAKDSKEAKPSLIESAQGFFAGVKAEYSKIIFPNQETLKRETIATITVSFIIGLLIFVLDTILKTILGFIL